VKKLVVERAVSRTLLPQLDLACGVLQLVVEESLMFSLAEQPEPFLTYVGT
jgi:hypothetical protein